MDGHADDVAASSRAEERMVAGRMAAVYSCACTSTLESPQDPREGCCNCTTRMNVTAAGRVAHKVRAPLLCVVVRLFPPKKASVKLRRSGAREAWAMKRV